MSELGQTGGAAAGLYNTASYAAAGLLALFAVGLWASAAATRMAGALMLVPAAAFVTMASSPCSAGCPIVLVDAAATTSDAVHNAAAIAALVAMSTAAWIMADRVPPARAGARYRQASRWAGTGVAISSAVFGWPCWSGHDR